MHTKLSKLMLLLCPLFLFACSDSQPPGRQMVTDSKVLATVNGTPITQAELDILVKSRRAANSPITADKAINELIEIELLRQQAVAQEIHKKAEIASEMNIESTQVLATAAIKTYMKDLIISEQELMMEYNKYTENLGDKQYHLRHILSKTKNEAEINIADLKKGQKFTELAKKRSIDFTGENGGDLGWIIPTTFPEPFYDALKATKPGNYHPEPLQSNKGWHVLKVEAHRAVEPRSFDEVRNNLKVNITNQRIKSYLAELRSEAKITLTEKKESKNHKEETEKTEAKTEDQAKE